MIQFRPVLKKAMNLKATEYVVLGRSYFSFRASNLSNKRSPDVE